jgi:putative Mn2+ efflux pump MntP
MELYIFSLFLGIALAMDACAVSMANGLNQPCMKLRKVLFIACMFGFFQGAMPLIGYFLGHALLSLIEPFIPWIALVILTFLGVRMIIEAMKNEECENRKALTFSVILIQAIATSIDALSTGFAIANYSPLDAVICASIVMVVTAIICIFAVYIGKKFGTKFGSKAEIIGGIILIAIGLEIFITGVFF